MRKLRRVLLGLGSNVDFDGKSSLEILEAACAELKAILADPVFSSVYKTKAMYVTDQNDFYNMVVLGSVPDEMTPFDLLKLINRIEARYGRNREKEIRFGPRPLDIDIELFGNETINTEILQIPHIRLKERAFVLIPALEILNKNADENIRGVFKDYLDKLSSEDKDEVVFVDSTIK